MSSADDARGGHAADGVLVQAPAGEGGDQGATGSTGSTAVGAVVATKGTADRVRLWKDSKAWLDGICKRLQISEVEAAECANIKDTQTFKSWHATGQPSHVTRLLRVWVKSVLRAAQIAADARAPAGIADGRGVAADAGDGGDEELDIVGVKRKRGQCKACAGMHRPHTCGKVGSSSAGLEGEANAPKLIQGANAQRGGEGGRLRQRATPINYKNVMRVIHRSQWNTGLVAHRRYCACRCLITVCCFCFSQSKAQSRHYGTIVRAPRRTLPLVTIMCDYIVLTLRR